MIGTNRAARPLLKNGTGLAVDAELLIWQAVEEGLPYAYQGEESDSGHVRRALNPHFHWDCGFKVGLSYDFNYDGWDTHRQMVLRTYALADSLLGWERRESARA